MKKGLSIMLLLMLTLAINAQKEVTKFLGIPVDGTKSAMTEKLKAKGFNYISTYDCFEGEFNGERVLASVNTNNNKVWRIFVMDAFVSDETTIKKRFNNLCRQFEKSPNYEALTDDSQILSENENIGYQMMAHDKEYKAQYYQVTDSTFIDRELEQYAHSKYTQEQMDNPTEAIVNDVSRFTMDLLTRKSVWFLIGKEEGGYRIILYYDNEYNSPQEDEL